MTGGLDDRVGAGLGLLVVLPMLVTGARTLLAGALLVTCDFDALTVKVGVVVVVLLRVLLDLLAVVVIVEAIVFILTGLFDLPLSLELA